MNSLEELNQWNLGTSVTYTDQRIAGVYFDRAAAVNQSVIANEGSTFISPVGIEITDIANPTIALCSYTINLTNAPAGTTLSWPTLPEDLESSTPSPNNYRVQYINTVNDWTAIKNPTVDLPSDFIGTFTYTVTLSYVDGNLGAQTKSWTVAATVVDLTILNLPLETEYDKSANTKVNNPPQILYDTGYESATWTLVGTPSNNAAISTWFQTSTAGGSFNVNSSTKVFTIVGNKTQVNSILNNLFITANTNTIDFFMTYLLSNNIDAATDTKTQVFKNTDIQFFSNPTVTQLLYSEDTAFLVTGMPLITDSSYSGSGNYTVNITPSTTAGIKTMSAGGIGGTVTFNNTTKVLTIVGTKSQVNSQLNAITITPGVDFASVVNLTYLLTTPNVDSATKIQTLICNSNDVEVENMTVARSYISNNVNLIFTTNTPVITDFDTAAGNVYTIAFNCAFGEWSFDGVTLSNPISFSGTREECNAKFSQLRFYPNVNVSSNGTFTYTQLKNSQTQTTVTVALNGSVGTYQSRTVDFTVTTLGWTPTVEDVKYGKIDNILITGAGGGGGGGGVFSGNSQGGGGGGGGGVQYSTTDILFTAGTSYNITIGAGGSGGVSGSSGAGTSSTAGTSGGTTTAFGLSIAGGTGGDLSRNGGNSGPGIGSALLDDSGMTGGLKATSPNSTGGFNGGGGAGHPSFNGPVFGATVNGNGGNATSGVGGRGSFGFDMPGLAGYWGSGGGGGGTTRGNNGSAISGRGAGAAVAAETGQTGGGGGGGGYAAYNGARGGDGLVRINITAR